MLNIKFHSEPIYDEKYIKTKVKTFSNMINTPFSGNEKNPKEKIPTFVSQEFVLIQY